MANQEIDQLLPQWVHATCPHCKSISWNMHYLYDHSQVNLSPTSLSSIYYRPNRACAIKNNTFCWREPDISIHKNTKIHQYLTTDLLKETPNSVERRRKGISAIHMQNEILPVSTKESEGIQWDALYIGRTIDSPILLYICCCLMRFSSWAEFILGENR